MKAIGRREIKHGRNTIPALFELEVEIINVSGILEIIKIKGLGRGTIVWSGLMGGGLFIFDDYDLSKNVLPVTIIEVQYCSDTKFEFLISEQHENNSITIHAQGIIG